MLLYSILLVLTISVPLVLSFEKKLRFYKQFRYLIPAIILVGGIYIAFDVYMTEQGVWGFNPEYHLNLLILGLPLEEWLFFIVIPYASVFLHETIVNLYPNLKLSEKTSKVLSIILIIIFSSLSIVYIEKTYTFYIFIKTTIALILSYFDKSDIMEHFYLTYLVILVPFFIVNSILTGSFIEREVVWYNDSENLGIRILTIPIEDFAYGFSLILLVLLTRNFLKKLHQVLWA